MTTKEALEKATLIFNQWHNEQLRPEGRASIYLDDEAVLIADIANALLEVVNSERERAKVLVEALEWITRPRYGTELPRCEQDEHDNNEIAARWHFEDTKTAREALAKYRE